MVRTRTPSHPSATQCGGFAATKGRRCRNLSRDSLCHHHRTLKARRAEQEWWTRQLLNSPRVEPRRLGEAVRRVRTQNPTEIEAEVLAVVEDRWESYWEVGVAVIAPGDAAGRLVSVETMARLESEEEDPCASLGWLAHLFLLGLDFGFVSITLAEIEFVGLAESGVTGDVWSELHTRLTDDGVELTNEELAAQLRLLGVHVCRRRGWVEACVCLAEFTAEELRGEITLRGSGGKRQRVLR